jgi:hypothetical protein
LECPLPGRALDGDSIRSLVWLGAENRWVFDNVNWDATAAGRHGLRDGGATIRAPLLSAISGEIAGVKQVYAARASVSTRRWMAT